MLNKLGLKFRIQKLNILLWYFFNNLLFISSFTYLNEILKVKLVKISQ